MGLKLSLLLGLGGLGDAGVLAELLQPSLGILQGGLRTAVVEPGQRLLDPLKELRGRGRGAVSSFALKSPAKLTIFRQEFP